MMQFVAKLHSPRPGVNPLQTSFYGASADLLGQWARRMLATEPVGAWVEILERVEVPRRQYKKVKGENGESIIESVVCTEASGIGQESGSQDDAGEK